MESIVDNFPNNKHPGGFDLTTATTLIGLGAEDYIEHFRKHNIGQSTLKELTDEDLIKIGVDNKEVRETIVKGSKDLPASHLDSYPNSNLNAIDVTLLLNETAKHFQTINHSLKSNRLALKKSKELYDMVLHYDMYGCDIAIETIQETTNILNNMEKSLEEKFSLPIFRARRKKKKKIVIGVVGAATIALLSVLFVKSLRMLS